MRETLSFVAEGENSIAVVLPNGEQDDSRPLTREMVERMRPKTPRTSRNVYLDDNPGEPMEALADAISDFPATCADDNMLEWHERLREVFAAVRRAS